MADESTDMCQHEEVNVICDGTEHVLVCQECGEDVGYEPCPEAGTRSCEDAE